MRTILVLALSCCCIASVSAQDSTNVVRLDTIYASTVKTTSLIFPKKITIFDIGSEDFGGIKDDNLLLLKAAHDKAEPTSLLIKYGENIYHGTVAYTPNPKKLFIDFGKLSPTLIPQLPNETRVSKNDSLKTLDAKITEKRLNILISEPKSPYKTYAVQEERIIFSLAHMMTDEENVYLKLLFINDSKLDYKVDFVEFVYQDPHEGKELRGTFDRKNVYPNASNNIDLIAAKGQRFLGYSIPRYTLSKKGELVIVVRQKNGSRAMTLKLPFSLILEAKPINK